MFEYRKYCLNLHCECPCGIRIEKPTSKLISKWLTELQKTAQLAELACQSALSALFQRVTSIRSILTFVSIAVLVLMLALWVQSYRENNSLQKHKKKAKAQRLGFFYVFPSGITPTP